MKKIVIYCLFSLLLTWSVDAFAKTFLTCNNNILVTSMTHDSQYLYVGTKKGLFVIDKVQKALSPSSQFSGRINNNVRAVMMNGADLWVGIDCWRAMNVRQGIVESFYDMSGGWANLIDKQAVVSSLSFSPQGDTAASIWDWLFIRNGQQTDTFWLETSLGEGGIEDMHYDSTGALWVVCSGNWTSPFTLCRYTHEKGLEAMLNSYLESGCSQTRLSSYCLAIDACDHVWLGTVTGAVVEFNGQDVLFHENDLGLTCVSDIAFDTNGTLWLLASKGGEFSLVSYDGKNFSSHRIHLVEGERCDCLDIDGDTFYVGTNKRLIIINNWQQTPVALSESDVSGIDESNDSHLRIATYDLQGRRLSARPARGLYIKGGRKRMVR